MITFVFKGFVLFIAMMREAADDILRWMRDNEINKSLYTKVEVSQNVKVQSQNIKVSDIIKVEKNQRVPADMVLLRTSESDGTCYVRTDQLDGEIDWKVRVAPATTQNLKSDQVSSLLQKCSFFKLSTVTDILECRHVDIFFEVQRLLYGM